MCVCVVCVVCGVHALSVCVVCGVHAVCVCGVVCGVCCVVCASRVCGWVGVCGCVFV